jgi:hypothetical protein
MTRQDLIGQLRRLCEGLADREIRSGTDFHYDGSRLHADEVSDLLLPSVLCLAQDLSERAGTGSLGFRFTLGSGTGIDLPLSLEVLDESHLFLEVAPFVVEVFDQTLMECRADLLRLFEAAVQVIRPDFTLERHTSFRQVPAAGSSPFKAQQ